VKNLTIVDVGLPIGETASAVILAGRTPSVARPSVPVSLFRRQRKWSDRGSTKSTFRWTGGMHSDVGF
jgi:hypothetical protein